MLALPSHLCDTSTHFFILRWFIIIIIITFLLLFFISRLLIFIMMIIFLFTIFYLNYYFYYNFPFIYFFFKFHYIIILFEGRFKTFKQMFLYFKPQSFSLVCGSEWRLHPRFGMLPSPQQLINTAHHNMFFHKEAKMAYERVRSNDVGDFIPIFIT